MAKGIDINGQLRGKRGGVVYYRTNGQQISRSRNFSPKNPKTDRQLIQRAVTATVMKMYQAGKAIFDHSFEGKQVPAGSQREFYKRNMNALRAQIIADMKYLENHPEVTTDDELVTATGTQARVVSPSADTCNAFGAIISAGTYKDPVLYIEDKYLMLPGTNVTDQTIAGYFAEFGIVEGDIFTLCVVTSKYDGMSRISSPESQFGFVRMITKAGSSSALVGAKVSDLFTIEGYNVNSTFVTQLGNQTLSADRYAARQALDNFNVDADNFLPSAAGIICSRDDMSVRSNSTMQVLDQNLQTYDPWSVTALSLVESWRRSAEQVDSSLILEGGNF